MPVIRRSLNFMLIGNIFGQLFGIVCGGGTAAVIGLATSMGASDLTFSILMAVTQGAALLQIPFSLLVNRTHKRKRYMLTIGLGSRIFWLLLGLIPILVPEIVPNIRVFTMVFLIGISCCMSAVINVSWFPWFSEIVPLTIQSRFIALRDVILNGVNFVGGIVISLLLDYLPPETKYIIVFIIGGSAGILDMVSFGFCKEVYKSPPRKTRFSETLGSIIKNKPFLRFMLYWTAYNFTSSFMTVYMNPYSINVMGLTFTEITVFGTIAAAVSAIIALPQWGKAIYHYGSKNVFIIAGIGSSAVTLFYLFSSPHNIWPVFLRNLIGAWFWSGANVAATNEQLMLSPEETRPTYIAVFSCMTALFGASFGSLASGFALDLIKSTGWFTGWFDPYKALFVLAVVLRAAVLATFLPRLTNDNQKKLPDLIRAIFRRK